MFKEYSLGLNIIDIESELRLYEQVFLAIAAQIDQF